jgi:hypothetical protein
VRSSSKVVCVNGRNEQMQRSLTLSFSRKIASCAEVQEDFIAYSVAVYLSLSLEPTMLVVRFLKGLIFPLKTAVNLAVRAVETLNRKELYGFDHAILSVELPPTKGMWMNLGYWKAC